MAIVIKRTGQKDYGRYIKMMIAGNPGAGKTLFSSTAPNPIWAASEPGLMSIADRNIPLVEIQKSDDMLELRGILRLEPEKRLELLGFPVDTLVVDTVNDFQDILVRERLKAEGKSQMVIQDWGWLAERMNTIFTSLRDLPLNVIFITHLKQDKDEDTGKVSYIPALSGQFGTKLPAMVDLALVLTSRERSVTTKEGVEKRMERHFITVPSDNYPFIKDRSGKLPYRFPVSFTDDFQQMYETIFAAVDDLEDWEEKVVTYEAPRAVAATGRKPQSAAEVKARIQRNNARKRTNPIAAERETEAESSGDSEAGNGDPVLPPESETPTEEPEVTTTVEPEPTTPEEVSDGSSDSSTEESRTADSPTTEEVNETSFVGKEEIDGKTVYNYVTKEGEKIVSYNELPEGVMPIPNGKNVGYFCEVSGREMPTKAKAEVSRAKNNRRIIHPDAI